MDKNQLSDERLILLHQQKKINAFFILYGRYKTYGYAIVLKTLNKTSYLNALKEEKDTIIYDALNDAIEQFDVSRGSFRNLFSIITERKTYNYIREFKRNPLSDYISIDALTDDKNIQLVDTLTFADPDPSPIEYINSLEQKNLVTDICNGRYKRKIRKMMKMRQMGFSYEEIAKHYHTTAGAIRSKFYRLKKKFDNKLR